MKALIFDKSKYSWDDSKGFELADVPMPKIEKPDDVIIRVHYAGVCGSDKGIWYRQAFKEQILGSLESEKSTSPNPSLVRRGTPLLDKERFGEVKSYRIIGHEFFGEVVEIGSRVKGQGIGDFVSCESHVVCNKCYQCLRGQKEVCTNEKILGISHDGGFAEYVRVPAHIVWKTDTSKIRPEVAAMQEPFGNAVHTASKVDLKDKTIAIFGLGPIGLFLLLVARAKGAKNIIGVEPNPVSIEMAKKSHPHPTSPLKGEENAEKSGIIPSPRGGGQGRGENYAHDPEVIAEIMKITDGIGVDVAFEMAGFNSSVNNTIASVRRGGDVILFGLKNGQFVLDADYNKLVMKGITMHCVAGRQIWQTWETTRALLEDSSNQIQEKLYNVILDQGKGTILPLAEYSKEKFEKIMTEHPKFLIQL